MIKKILLFILLPVSSVTAQNATYIKRQNNELFIGNGYIKRGINISPDSVGTNEIVNKLSGKVYKVHSDVFAMQIVFGGLGPAYGMAQNGENEVVMTAKDFKFTGFDEKNIVNGGKKLALHFKFNWQDTKFRVIVNYEVFPKEFSLKKWISIADSSYGIHFLDRTYVESMSFSAGEFSRGRFGQPVFNNDIFLGVEYPTVENKIEGDKVRIGYVIGKEIKKKPYITHTSIIGAAPSKLKLGQTFMNYVDSLKVNGTRPFLLYNSWYDFRNPAIAKDSASIMNQKNVLNRIKTFKEYLYDRYHIALNAFVLDDGWDNYKSMWAIDSTRFPHGFTPLVNALKPMHTKLGIWASPVRGYSNRDIRVNWAAAHGYEKTGDYLTLSGPKYKAAFKRVMAGYTKKYDLGYFKWDGFLLADNESNHGHLPGIYSRESTVSSVIQMTKAVRKVNPDIFLNITTGTWLSPWWLKYADCIWMQGGDFGYSKGVPSINDRDKAITYRDSGLWYDFRKLNLLFPMSSLMTHGIIKGRLNLLGGKNESLDSFSNEVMMYFGRGVMMWELYISPDLLSNGEWDSIASTIKWAKANKNVLEKTRMILGDPLKGEVYGYLHLRKNKGILLLRNPVVEKQKVSFELSPQLGDIDPSTLYYVKIIYPFNEILPQPVKMNQKLTLNLDGYEVLTAELIPANKINKKLPVGIRYSVKKRHIIVYGTPGEKERVETIGHKNLGNVYFKSKKNGLKYGQEAISKNNGMEFVSKLKMIIPKSYTGSKFGFLLEVNQRLQKDSKPQFEIKVNGIKKKLKIVESQGNWFWIVTNLTPGEKDLSYSAKFNYKVKGKISSWVIANEKLLSVKIGTASKKMKEPLPAKPYPADVRKEFIPIGNFDIQ